MYHSQPSIIHYANIILQNIYDNTCQLREKKLDIEEALQEEKKNNEGLKKDIESNNKKLKVVDSALKAAQNELEAFQVSWEYGDNRN